MAHSSTGRAETGDIGRVVLVGAGPGDPELLTLKAVRMLQSADVILFDALVSDEILDFAKARARRLLVGKRGGKPSCGQEEINALMIKLARQGKCVVRLKAGDPMIFGRAGEEIEALARAGIPVEIVPGVTSASAFAAALNLSLTHRDHARSLRFVTGHARDGALPEDLDWSLIARGRTTTIFYMGARTAEAIVTKLLGAGMPADTPAAAMAAASWPEQAGWAGSLANLSAGVASLPAGAPVIIGVGDVFAQASERIRREPSARAAF